MQASWESLRQTFFGAMKGRGVHKVFLWFVWGKTSSWLQVNISRWQKTNEPLPRWHLGTLICVQVSLGTSRHVSTGCLEHTSVGTSLHTSLEVSRHFRTGTFWQDLWQGKLLKISVFAGECLLFLFIHKWNYLTGRVLQFFLGTRLQLSCSVNEHSRLDGRGVKNTIKPSRLLLIDC